MDTSRPPFDDLDVRKAVIAGTDREGLRLLLGGEAKGQIAQHYLPPDMPGFEESGAEDGFSDLDWLREPSGDTQLAAQYFRAAGYPEGRYGGEQTLFIVGINSSPEAEVAQSVEEQLRQLGFKTRLRLYVPETVIGKFCGWPDSEVHVRPNTGWAKDFSDAQTMLDPTFNGEYVGETLTANVSELDDPRLNAMIAHARLVTGTGERARAWAEVNHAALRLAPTIPFLWETVAVARVRRRARSAEWLHRRLGSQLHVAEVTPAVRASSTARAPLSDGGSSRPRRAARAARSGPTRSRASRSAPPCFSAADRRALRRSTRRSRPRSPRAPARPRRRRAGRARSRCTAAADREPVTLWPTFSSPRRRGVRRAPSSRARPRCRLVGRWHRPCCHRPWAASGAASSIRRSASSRRPRATSVCAWKCSSTARSPTCDRRRAISSASLVASRLRSGSSAKSQKTPATRRPSSSSASSPVARSAARPGSISGAPSARPGSLRGERPDHGGPSAARAGDPGAVDRQAELGVGLTRAARVDQDEAERGGDARVQVGVMRPRPVEGEPLLGLEREDPRAGSVAQTAERLADGGDVRGVGGADRVLLARGGELLGGVVADGLGDGVADAVLAAVVAADERRVDQGAEGVERVDRASASVDLRDRFDGVERGRAGEGREPREQGSLVRRQQVVRPFERRAHAAVALGEVTRAADEHAERPLQAREQLAGRDRRHARGGEFERERHALDAGADGLDRLAVLVEVEVGCGRARSLLEQRHGAVGRQRSQSQEALGRDPQRQLAGHQHAGPRRLLEERGEGGRGVDELLEVVEHQQRRAGAQAPRHGLLGRAGVGDAQRRGDRRDQRAGVADAGKRHQPDTALEGRQQALGRGHGQPRLARATQPDDRDQPLLAGQHVPERGELGLTTDEPPGIGGEVRRAHRLGPQRREVARTPVVVYQQPEALGRREVLEPMLTEVDQLGT